MCFLFSNAVMC